MSALDINVNLLRPLLWRQNQAANLQALLTAKQAWYQKNVAQFWNDWYSDVFNLETANDFGLAVWARILQEPLTIITPANAGPTFGFGFNNLVTDPTDSGSTWTGANATVTAGHADPNGNAQAVLVDMSANTGSAHVAMAPVTAGIPAGAVTLTFKALLISGTQGTLASDANGTSLGTWPTLNTSTWTQVTLTGTLSALATAFNIVSPTSSTCKVAIFNPKVIAYNAAATTNQNFNNGNFQVSSAGVALSTDQKRTLLQLRYFQLISRCTVPELNERLKAILGKYGSVYVLDANDMSYTTYVFGFQPNSALQFILENFDVLPHPAGVGVRTLVSTRPTFGFGPYNQNFNNGTFAS